jgi:hypothetical protein
MVTTQSSAESQEGLKAGPESAVEARAVASMFRRW